MKTYLDCIPCFLKQALFAARAASGDERIVKRVLDRTGAMIAHIPLDSPPPETARRVYGIVREVTGVADPFSAHKDRSIRASLEMYGEMKAVTAASPDPLRTAIGIAIAGNVIDFGASPKFDLEAEMRDIARRALAVDDYESFRKSVAKARSVLFLGDNAGETVFDRILIETLGKETIYAVREASIINDATIADAKRSGLGEVARIVSSGCDAPGTILTRCSPEFRELYASADIIISKGQGNFESLSEDPAPLFFLLKVKCPVAARHLGTPTGGLILKNSRL